MSLSAVYFLKNFASPTSGNDYLIRTAQAADADEMARVYSKNLAEIVALNATIQSADDKYTPVDAMLAGAGDGHSFIYTVTLARARLNAPQQLLLGQQVIPWNTTGGAPGVFTGLPTAKDTVAPPYDNPTLGPIAAGVATTPAVPAITQPDPIAPAFIDPTSFVTRFGVAASQDEVQAVHNKLVDDIAAFIVAAFAPTPVAVLNGFYCPFQAIAGGAKGTRFMVTVTGLPVFAPQIG